jgi:hypothetical protein
VHPAHNCLIMGAAVVDLSDALSTTKKTYGQIDAWWKVIASGWLAHETSSQSLSQSILASTKTIKIAADMSNRQ